MLETLTVLGGGGWFPAHERQTACALLRNGSSAIMIDAGTGLGRLAERPDLLDGLDRLDILLSHFHLDHTTGLAYLPAMGICQQTTVWGPGRALYGRSTASLLEQFSHEPFHPVPLEQQDIEVRDLPPDGVELGGVRIACRRQDRHSAPSLGFRFEDTLAWITDTAFDPGSASFAEGCALLAHEAWFTTAAPRNADIHSSASEAASIADAAGIDRLLLIHLPPFEASVDDVLDEAAAGAAHAMLAHDGAELALQMT